MTSAGIEPATFRFVAQHLKHYATAVPTVEPYRPQMTIWRMRIACWITKTTDTHSEYVIGVLIASPLQQWLHERTSILRYTDIACLVRRHLCSKEEIPLRRSRPSAHPCRSYVYQQLNINVFPFNSVH